MKSGLSQSPAGGIAIADSADVSMHVWRLGAGDGKKSEESCEVELIASHSSDPYHLDPACIACRRLCSQLQSIAQAVVERVAQTAPNAIRFQVYADDSRIVCSRSDGLRPCVTASIYVRDGLGVSRSNGVSDGVSQITKALGNLGIRER